MALNTASKRNREDSFKFWSRLPSQTEQEKCTNAESVNMRAISWSAALNNRRQPLIYFHLEGIASVFPNDDAERILSVIEDVNKRAEAA